MKIIPTIGLEMHCEISKTNFAYLFADENVDAVQVTLNLLELVQNA